MKLWTINKILKFFGFVIVVAIDIENIDDPENMRPTLIYLSSDRNHLKECEKHATENKIGGIK